MTKQTFTTGQVLTAAQMTSLQQTAMGGGSTTAKTASYVLVAADAGTVVQMNAAGATTITVNTALFAAGDSVQIQNVGAGVCTVTAGTATVSTAGSLALSQYEGGQLYFNTTSAALFFDIVQSSGMTNPMTTTGDMIYSSSGSTPARLGIGSTGQVVTVAGGIPSWATPAGGGGMTLLSTTTLSGTSTTISSIDQSYQDLYIIHYGLTNSSADGNQYFKPNNTSSATFTFTNQGTTAGAGTFTNVTAQAMYFMADSNKIKMTDSNNAWATTIRNYSSSTTYKPFNIIGAFMGANGSRTALSSNGAYESNTAITSIVVVLDGGGTYSTGTVKIYGVK